MLQASVCDEQLMSIGGEIALSGNKHAQTKKNTGILQLVLGPCNSCVLEPVLDRFIHFNCFNRKLDFLGFLDSFEFLVRKVQFCPISAQISSIFDFPRAFVNMSAAFNSYATFTTRECFAATRTCSHSILVCM